VATTRRELKPVMMVFVVESNPLLVLKQKEERKRITTMKKPGI
jgi:hypothetical protein